MSLFPRTVTLKDGTQAVIRRHEKRDDKRVRKNARRMKGSAVQPWWDIFMKAELYDGVHNLSLVAEIDGRLVGQLYFQGHMGISIVEWWRNKGLGNAMVDAFLEWAQASPNGVIGLSCDSNNSVAMAMWKKRGWVKTDVHPNGDDIMILPLKKSLAEPGLKAKT